ncbi:hypothetical protein EYF80_022385 [Liparis tanakae]|uniref:Uncharacterized protein n=1 Tax=Liparis tanakae TaxID=230148 RepID=A0A4Z2HNL4_9TELE|nr:hypothetical protein EYF80_022385 [Liparis tanakae]
MFSCQDADVGVEASRRCLPLRLSALATLGQNLARGTFSSSPPRLLSPPASRLASAALREPSPR